MKKYAKGEWLKLSSEERWRVHVSNMLEKAREVGDEKMAVLCINELDGNGRPGDGNELQQQMKCDYALTGVWT